MIRHQGATNIAAACLATSVIFIRSRLCHIGLIPGIEQKPMASTLEEAKLSSPRIFLFRMLVFLVLCGLIAFVLQRQILNAFMANPWLNGLIVGVLLIGIILSFARVIRLFPEVSWVNRFRRADPELANGADADALGADGRDPWRRAARPGRPRRDLGANHARVSRTRSAPGSTKPATFRAISPVSWCSSDCSARSGA